MKLLGLKEIKLILKVVNYLKNKKFYYFKFINFNVFNEVTLIFIFIGIMMEVNKL